MVAGWEFADNLKHYHSCKRDFNGKEAIDALEAGRYLGDVYLDLVLIRHTCTVLGIYREGDKAMVGAIKLIPVLLFT